MAVKVPERQARERAHYDARNEQDRITEIDFDHFSQRRFGPWNPYWRVYDYVLQEYPPPGPKLLSYGCGRGAQALRYARQGYDVHGFDISEKRIENARALAEQYGLQDRVRFTIQAAENLDYPSRSFDVVVGENILHHIDLGAALVEISRVLKADGCAIFKDSVQTPFRDRIRNSRAVTWILPKGTKNFSAGTTYHPTDDERNLDDNDLAMMRDHFPKITIEKFRVIALLSALIGNRPVLERVDWLLFRLLPFARRFGDHVVLIMRKE
jgi:2-polyprenyl-3-methyl-5-hydroxy-6-metoxy-1,4-benzoquinol methylase